MNDNPQELVVAFCRAWERRSLSDVLGYLAEDIVYQNVPRPAMNGIDAVRGFLAPIFNRTTKIDFQVLSIATSSNNEVLTERMDRLHFPNGVVEIPIMGIFAVRDGKITHWRDYPDSAAVEEQFASLAKESA
jgi:limonene-1,2-epoxide hydrolase